MSNELPTGWTLAPLGMLARYFNGRAFKPTEWETSGLPIIRIQNLNDHSAPFNYSSNKYDDRFFVRNGDLLVAWSASLGAFIWQGGDAWLNQHIFRVEHNRSACLKEFLFYAVLHAIKELYDKAHGTGMVHVTKPVFEAHTVPLPPIAEQRHIVAKLAKLLGKVDACKKRLDRIPGILKRFRQSILAAACSGRLTEDWREKNPPVESIDSIIETIRHKRQNEAKTPNQDKKIVGIYKQIEQKDSDELPLEWKFVILAKLAESFDYGTSAKSSAEGKMPVLRMGNIQNGKLDWSDLVYTSDEKEIEKYRLTPGTVLFNRTNSPELVGKTAIYRGEQPAIFAGYLIRTNPFPELNPEYLNLCLNTNDAHEFCQQVKTDGVSQSNINAQKLAAFEIPFCHPDEQNEIVRRVESLFSLADKCEARYQKAKSFVEKLTQSILAKAFRGELVPQDPNDESALLLLNKAMQKHGNYK